MSWGNNKNVCVCQRNTGLHDEVLSGRVNRTSNEWSGREAKGVKGYLRKRRNVPSEEGVEGVRSEADEGNGKMEKRIFR